jgi:hypothetical protein
LGRTLSAFNLLPSDQKVLQDKMTAVDAMKDDTLHQFPPTSFEEAPRGSDLPEASLSGTTTPTSTSGFTAALPPVDTGYAWIFLAAGFVIGKSAKY